MIGRVLETGPTTARILLVSDGKNVTPVKRAKDELPAFATGRGDGTVDIRPINIGNNPFEQGDLLTTSGSGGLYSPGIPVAMVIEKTETGAIGRILANPANVGHVIVQPIFQAETVAQIEMEESEAATEENE